MLRSHTCSIRRRVYPIFRQPITSSAVSHLVPSMSSCRLREWGRINSCVFPLMPVIFTYARAGFPEYLAPRALTNSPHLERYTGSHGTGIVLALHTGKPQVRSHVYVKPRAPAR